MSSNFKAFAVVFAVSLIVLFFFAKPYGKAVGSKRYGNWLILWLSITTAAFVVSDFLLFAGISAILVFAFSRAEPAKPAIYALLIAATPAYDIPLKGFAGMNMLINVSLPLVVAAIVLLPTLFSAKRMKKTTKVGITADRFFLLWLLLELALATRAPTFTHMLRTGLESFLMMAPLYYGFSRYPKAFDNVRVISAAFILPVIILSALSIIEIVLSWHFYDGVIRNWYGQLPFGYKLRGGFLRASVSAFNPLAWGFVAMSAIGVAMAVFNDRFSKFYRYAGFLILAAGLLTSLSRGPWVGALVAIAVFIMVSRKAVTRTFQLSFGLLVAFGIASTTSFGRSILSFLPFLGESGGDTISYRQQLLSAAMEVIRENPLFGSANYLAHPKLQAMRQGEGIIDLVNVYVEIALKSGVIGVVFFIGIFLSTLAALRNAMKSARNYNPKLALYCQAYFATIAGMMVAISTTSNIGQIPLFSWSFLGVGIALARIEKAQREAKGQSVDVERTGINKANGTASPDRTGDL